jgi:transcriptional regulator with XRE-family HTH domain
MFEPQIRYREGIAYTLEDSARCLGCDRSRISRIETGQRGISVSDLRILLTDYGVEDPAQSVLAAIADPRIGRGWWRKYTAILSRECQEYLALETVASQVLIYEAQRVPELLQIPAYAQAFAAASPFQAGDGTGKAAEAVQARQRAVLDGPGPQICVVIGEVALRQSIGGASVMRTQIASLAETNSGNPRITVRVLPLKSGAHPAVTAGSLAILRFPDMPALGVVYLDGAGDGICLEDSRNLAAYARMFEQLKAFASSTAASARLLHQLSAA